MAGVDHPLVQRVMQEERDIADRVLELARYMAGRDDPDPVTVLAAAVVALVRSQ